MIFLAVAIAMLASSADSGVKKQAAPQGVGEWKAALGNHRARVSVTDAGDAVRVHLVWRRRDLDPQAKQILVFSADGAAPVSNVKAISIGRLSGDLAFQPAKGVGDYFIYYMPFTTTGSPYFPTVNYPPPSDKADPGWLTRNHLQNQELAAGAWQSLPTAKVDTFEDRSSFDRLDPMELIAGPAETEALKAAHPGSKFLLFPEDRAHPIKMTADLPERWAKEGPRGTFVGVANLGEFFTFQIGVYAARTALHNIQVGFRPDLGKANPGFPGSAFRCINTGGTDWLGRQFKKRLDVASGHIAALWCGVQIPAHTRPGVYRKLVTVSAAGEMPTVVSVLIHVTPELARDGGDANPANMTRLRWLDSTIGLDNQVVAPYTPLSSTRNATACLGRRVEFSAEGLPSSIRSGDQEILARPIQFVAEVGGVAVGWKPKTSRFVSRAPGMIRRETEAQSGSLKLQCMSKMEADGYVNYSVSFTAGQTVDFDDLRLEIPFRRDVATYMMGMGRKGGYRPAEWKWDWKSRNANNMLWIGDVRAGLQCKLKDVDDTWDLFKLSHLPDAWNNGGLGGCTVTEAGDGEVLMRAFSGPRRVKAGQTLHFNFGLLITPVKPLDPAHWSWRYDHEYIAPEKAKANGATVINIHQGNELNPNINYPFIAADKLKAYVQKAHRLGLKVKIYYTVRELSNRVVEMWALRSLGDEVFTDGPGGGDSWLQEHLVDHYKPAWHTPLPDGSVDAAITTAGLSRWHNYYLEGLRWLIENVGIDGLYLDGIGYDREIMKRVRKVMDHAKPGCLIDFHCGNSFAPEYGMNSPANQFMEHFPYMSSLWLGEGFDYNETPDYWLVEVSGIPFGMYGEMLEGNGNPWRGMVYGMTARYYSGADPKHIWKLWDDFGIADAKMFGYWTTNCPVRTNSPGVLATAYVRKGRTLISLASWEKETVKVKLAIDWRALGIDPQRVELVAPSVSGFQPETHFGANDEISVGPGKGWLIEVSEKR